MTSTTGAPGGPLLTTNNGVAIPQIGLGTGQVSGDDVVASIGEATLAGYRLIDTAKAYQKEVDVGLGIGATGLILRYGHQVGVDDPPENLDFFRTVADVGR